MKSDNSQYLPESLQKPWKYLGYRAYSTFLDSDHNFLIFRRFGTLNTRILLSLQDKIAVAEKELEQIDIHNSRTEAGDIHNGSFRHEMIIEREMVLDRIHSLIHKYNKLLLQYSTICTWPTAPKRNVQSVQNWLHNASNAIQDEEAAYIKQSHDLIALAPKAKSPLRRLFERSYRFRSAEIWKKQPSEEMHVGLPYPETVYYINDARVENFVRLLITLLGMIMLIVPLWILATTDGTLKRLGIITGFVMLFLSLVAFTTTARPFKSLAAAAAYAAVLVVFLQSTG